MKNKNQIILYIVRHGQTEFNIKGLIQGHADSPLTKRGIDGAEALGVGLKDIEFISAYSSSSKRAEDTAKYIIGDRNIDLKILDNLRELCFGSLEKTAFEDSKDIMNFDDIFNSFDLSSYGGESIGDLSKRMEKTIREIVDKHKETGGNILIVSHGMSIISYLYSLDNHLKGIVVPNVSVTTIKYRDGIGEIIKIGDTSFLK